MERAKLKKDAPQGPDMAIPFHQENLKTLQGNLLAFESLLRRAKPPRRVVEAMGGTGCQSRVIRKVFPEALHQAWDRDESCYEKLKTVPNMYAFHGEYPVNATLGPGVLLVTDFHFTLKYRDYYEPFFKTGAGQMIFTDLARGKLHLHPQAYGLPKEARWPEYVNAVADWISKFDYTLKDTEWAPRSISYFLAEKA